MTAVPTEAITVAARAYCLLRFSYDGAYQADADREAHIAADASSTAAEPWLAAVLEAAAPLIAAQAAERWRLNARRMALLAEAFVHEPQRITESGLIPQVHRVLTDQDVEWLDGDPAVTAAPLIAAQAAAAERERIRQLAIETCASYYGVDQATGQSVLREFADLIGEERRLADGDGWDTARDRITEANQARADERERLRPLLDLLVKLARWSGHDLADLLSQAGCPDLLADLTGGDPS